LLHHQTPPTIKGGLFQRFNVIKGALCRKKKYLKQKKNQLQLTTELEKPNPYNFIFKKKNANVQLRYTNEEL